MRPSEFLRENDVKGFLAQDEGERLDSLVREVAHLGPCLEVGSYCGKSTVYLGLACQDEGATLYAVDHHRGSEEHQLGEEYHDPELYDQQVQRMDSFPVFRRTLAKANLEDTVVPIVATSEVVRRHWQTPLSLVFIDGGHSEPMAIADCLEWSRFIVPGGILAVHDIFPNPEDGGQGPWMGLTAVLETGSFELLDQVNSLGALRRKAD